MLCYKDMTFCGFKDCKKFKVCVRAMTPEVIKGARKICLPIEQFNDKPDCFRGEK
jgi:hypothetical protein